MKDEKTTFEDLRDRVSKFRKERGWKSYDNPKDLSMAISIEGGELMENFLFVNREEVGERIEDEEKFTEIRREIADILIYSIALANLLDLDIVETVEEKVQRIKEREP